MSQIIPAILTDDPKIFEHQLRQVEGLTDIIHIDISDGIFVPQKTLGVEEIKAVKTDLKFELHLMVQNPAGEIEKCSQIKNVAKIIFHLEATKNPLETIAVIKQIKENGWSTGLALNPETLLAEMAGYAYQIDFLLLMSVTPGRQGQKFIPEIIEKIKEVKNKYPELPLEIDGGIHQAELPKLVELEVDYIIMGSEIFSHKDPGGHLKEMQEMIKNF